MYTSQEIATVLGVSRSRLRAYQRSGCVAPTPGDDGAPRFTFQDLVWLRKAEGLIARRVAPRRVNAALKKVAAAYGQPRAIRLNLEAEGNEIIVVDGDRKWLADSGQVVLDFFNSPPPALKASKTHSGAFVDSSGRRAGQRGSASGSPICDGAVGTSTDNEGAPKLASVIPLEHRKLRLAREKERQQKHQQERQQAFGREALKETAGMSAQEIYEHACLKEDEDVDTAREWYLRCIEVDPKHADAHVNLGRLLHEGDRPDAAQIHYKLALAARPDDAIAAFNLGVALEDLDQNAESIEAYQIAIRLDPSNADAHYNLARLMEQDGNAEGAVRHLIIYRQLTRPSLR